MRYLLATVIVAVPDDEMDSWSERSEVTRFVGFDKRLHEPELGLWLHRHDEFPMISELQFQRMHKCIDEQGGI
jgi:hypothetical protein